MNNIDGSNKAASQNSSVAKGAGQKEDPIINGSRYHYTRIAIETEVWQAMKFKKVYGDESYTDQINNGMREYLKDEIPQSKSRATKTKPNQ